MVTVTLFAIMEKKDLLINDY